MKIDRFVVACKTHGYESLPMNENLARMAADAHKLLPCDEVRVKVVPLKRRSP